jgi:hypothetical protein
MFLIYIMVEYQNIYVKILILIKFKLIYYSKRKFM